MFGFSCLGVNVNIRCDHFAFMPLLRQNFEGMKSTVAPPYDLDYQIQLRPDQRGYELARRDSDFDRQFNQASELIYLLEGDLVVQLQLLRSDLYFLHSAVVAFGEEAHLLVGGSGAGKSTTCWGLLHHGYHYVSDELAPISINEGVVSPYSHALCMKSPPPVEYPIPDTTCATGRGYHVPLSAMPTSAITTELPVRTIFFVDYQPDSDVSTATSIGHAEAAARLYPNALNALAHVNDGLDAARRLTSNVSCFRVNAGALQSTCDLIDRIVRTGNGHQNELDSAES